MNSRNTDNETFTLFFISAKEEEVNIVDKLLSENHILSHISMFLL